MVSPWLQVAWYVMEMDAKLRPRTGRWAYGLMRTGPLGLQLQETKSSDPDLDVLQARSPVRKPATLACWRAGRRLAAL